MILKVLQLISDRVTIHTLGFLMLMPMFITFVATLILHTKTIEAITNAVHTSTQPLCMALYAHMCLMCSAHTCVHTGLCLPYPPCSHAATGWLSRSQLENVHVILTQGQYDICCFSFWTPSPQPPIVNSSLPHPFIESRGYTQFLGPLSLSAQSCKLALTVAPLHTFSPVPVDPTQQAAISLWGFLHQCTKLHPVAPIPVFNVPDSLLNF